MQNAPAYATDFLNGLSGWCSITAKMQHILSTRWSTAAFYTDWMQISEHRISQQMDWMARSCWMATKATRLHAPWFCPLGTFEVCCIQECPRTIQELKKKDFSRLPPNYKRNTSKGSGIIVLYFIWEFIHPHGVWLIAQTVHAF